MGTVSNIRMEPMEVYIGTDQKLTQTITCVADVSSSLNNKYFLMYTELGVKHYFWFNVGAAGADPGAALTGYTANVVAFAANASAATVATALELVIEAVTGLDSTVSGGVVTVTNTNNGYCAFAHDAQATASQCGFAFSVTQVGDTFANVGYIEGDIEVGGLSRNPVDINSHQTGATVLGQILSGAGNPELSFTLKEVTLANYRKILNYSNGEFYPVAASSTSGIGGGSKGQFGSPVSAKIVLHPVRLGIADKTNDYCFWKCTLDLDSIAFSGENILNLPVTAKAFEDTTKQDAVDVWMYGDWSQSFANS